MDPRTEKAIKKVQEFIKTAENVNPKLLEREFTIGPIFLKVKLTKRSGNLTFRFYDDTVETPKLISSFSLDSIVKKRGPKKKKKVGT